MSVEDGGFSPGRAELIGDAVKMSGTDGVRFGRRQYGSSTWSFQIFADRSDPIRPAHLDGVADQFRAAGREAAVLDAHRTVQAELDAVDLELTIVDLAHSQSPLL
jgi:hypothetical protein